MHATCPRCETIILVSQEAEKFNCPTCRIRYCRHCQAWKERGQKYCLECWVRFSWPPSAIHASLKQWAGLVVLGVLLLALFRPVVPPWRQTVCSLAVVGAYFAVYLARFQRRTLLTWAAWHEAVWLTRQGVIWASLAYFIIYRGQPQTLMALIAGALLAVGLGLLAVNRLSKLVLDELRANRATWKAVLGMRLSDALLMRFPSAYP